jgi:Domain of unknown function (DUF4258)
MNFRLSDHAEKELRNRRIPKDLAESVLNHPEQKVPESIDIMCYQPLVDFAGDKKYLLRVMVNETADPAVVVTVYRTSKIEKYWRTA